MTGVAGHAFVTAYQSEPGRRKVIESRIVPSLGVVTIRTLATVSTLMNVIRSMAGNAGTSNIRKVFLLMAGVAGDSRMPAV